MHVEFELSGAATGNERGSCHVIEFCRASPKLIAMQCCRQTNPVRDCHLI